jgi:hypothetical protein
VSDAHAQQTSHERRRAPRLPTHFSVDATHLDEPHALELRHAGRPVPRFERVTNLSRRGMCLESTRRPDIGTHLVLRFALDGEDPVMLIGATRWARVERNADGNGEPPVVSVGVQLVGGSNHAFACLERALERVHAASSTLVATDGDSR